METPEGHFSDRFERQLIMLVKPVEFLYNKKDSNYRNNQAKDKKWREISQVLRIPEVKCRAKWKALRDQYSRELKRVKLLRTKSKTKIIPKWKHYESLRFLHDYIRTRGALKEEEEEPANYEEEEEYDETTTNDCKGVTWKVDFREFENSEDPIQEEYSESLGGNNESLAKTTDEKLSTPRIVAEVEDEIDSFFKSVAIKIRNMNLSSIEFTELQIDVLKIISEKIKMIH